MDVDDVIKLIEYTKESDKESIEFMYRIERKLDRIEGAEVGETWYLLATEENVSL